MRFSFPAIRCIVIIAYFTGKCNGRNAKKAAPPEIGFQTGAALPCGLNTVLLCLLFYKRNKARLHAVIILLDIVIVKMLL